MKMYKTLVANGLISAFFLDCQRYPPVRSPGHPAGRHLEARTKLRIETAQLQFYI